MTRSIPLTRITLFSIYCGTLFSIQSMHARGCWQDLCESLAVMFGTNAQHYAQASAPVKPSSSYSQYSPPSSVTIFSAQRAREYVEHTVANFEMVLGTSLGRRAFAEFKRAIFDRINNKNFSSKDEVDQLILSAILEFIEETSYQYALQRTGNRDLARRVANSMLNNALAVIGRRIPVNAYDLAPFVGRALQEAVDFELATLLSAVHHAQQTHYASSSSSSPSHATPHYETEDCCVCAESFNDVARVFLTPCGHDICKACARSWFFDQHKSTCPMCRATVDKTDLAKALR